MGPFIHLTNPFNFVRKIVEMCPIIQQIKKLLPSKLANKTSGVGGKMENLQFVTFQEIEITS